ncbi:hypothetical protein DPMN_169215 [Dreissena polymorpha]|uniref:Uncharacterized protein n=1 Tax=Dreissena polymorpha TaxID=45954 RepID=A0A9D4F6L3_DREPO|nr:hypothetical protein DPMN_169215 [Dreissena polymorpha]
MPMGSQLSPDFKQQQWNNMVAKVDSHRSEQISRLSCRSTTTQRDPCEVSPPNSAYP